LGDPQTCSRSDIIMGLMERAVCGSRDASLSAFLAELFVAPLHKAILLAELRCEPSVGCQQSVLSAVPLPVLVARAIQLLRAAATRDDGVATLRASHLRRCFRRRRVWEGLNMQGVALRDKGTPYALLCSRCPYGDGRRRRCFAEN
jgi:hypothetical protein